MQVRKNIHAMNTVSQVLWSMQQFMRGYLLEVMQVHGGQKYFYQTRDNTLTVN